MTELGICSECDEPVEGGAFHPTCCPHETVESEDIADGVVGNGAAHVWSHTCADCGAEVIPDDYGPGWVLEDPPDPPGAGRDPWGRPSDPRYWTE